MDAQNGIVRGVKILSRESSNSRRYDCLQQAARLYEGASVRVNHQFGDSDADRDAGDVLGELRNVRSRPDGLYGDLHLLKSHPMAKRVLEAARTMPRAYGLSHNVSDWEGHYEGGTYVVTAIHEVESVDLVADPATTKGLFESRKKQPKGKGRRMKLQEWLRKQRPEVRRGFRRLVEAGAVDGSMLLADGANPEASIRQAFLTAATAVLSDDTLDVGTALPRIKAILKARDDLMAAGAVSPAVDAPTEAAPMDDEPMGDEMTDDETLVEDDLHPDDLHDLEDAEGDEDDDLDSLEEGSDLEDDSYMDDDEEEKLVEAEDGDEDTFAASIMSDDDDEEEEEEEEEETPLESRRPVARRAAPTKAKAAKANPGAGKELARLREENRRLKTERHVRALCESQRVSPSPALLKALMALDDDGERRQLLRESRRLRTRPAAARDRAPLAEALTREEGDDE